MSFWPAANLGTPQRSYGHKEAVRAASEMRTDGGPNRARLKRRTALHEYSFQFVMTDAQHDEFWRYYTEDQDYGDKGFWMPLANVGAVDEVSTAGVIQGKPKSKPWDGYWVLDFKLIGWSPFDSYMPYTVVYGGPVTSPAPDDINAGSILSFPPDLIEAPPIGNLP